MQPWRKLLLLPECVNQNNMDRDTNTRRHNQYYTRKKSYSLSRSVYLVNQLHILDCAHEPKLENWLTMKSL